MSSATTFMPDVYFIGTSKIRGEKPCKLLWARPTGVCIAILACFVASKARVYHQEVFLKEPMATGIDSFDV